MQWADGREKRLRMLRPRPSTEGLFNEKSNAHVLSALTVNGNKITSTLQCPGIVVRIKGDDQQRCVLRAVTTSHAMPCSACPRATWFRFLSSVLWPNAEVQLHKSRVECSIGPLPAHGL